jgi:hypothetical protein
LRNALGPSSATAARARGGTVSTHHACSLASGPTSSNTRLARSRPTAMMQSLRVQLSVPQPHHTLAEWPWPQRRTIHCPDSHARTGPRVGQPEELSTSWLNLCPFRDKGPPPPAACGPSGCALLSRGCLPSPAGVSVDCGVFSCVPGPSVVGTSTGGAYPAPCAGGLPGCSCSCVPTSRGPALRDAALAAPGGAGCAFDLADMAKAARWLRRALAWLGESDPDCPSRTRTMALERRCILAPCVGAP